VEGRVFLVGYVVGAVGLIQKRAGKRSVENPEGVGIMHSANGEGCDISLGVSDHDRRKGDRGKLQKHKTAKSQISSLKH